MSDVPRMQPVDGGKRGDDIRTRVARNALRGAADRFEKAGHPELATRIGPDGRVNVPPRPPTGLRSATTGEGKTALMWPKARDEKGVREYRIFRNGKQIATVRNKTWWIDRNRTGNDKYQVRAVDHAGMVSAPVSETVIRDMSKPGPDGQPIAGGHTVMPDGQALPQDPAAAAAAQQQIAAAAQETQTPTAAAADAAPAGASAVANVQDANAAATMAAAAVAQASGATQPAGATQAAAGTQSQTVGLRAPAAGTPDTPTPPSGLREAIRGTVLAIAWQPSAGATTYGVYENDTLVGHTEKPLFAVQINGLQQPVMLSFDAVSANGKRSERSERLQVTPQPAPAAEATAPSQ